jgi:hypothetical protein
MKPIQIDAIRIDGGTQSRVAIDERAVTDYADALTAGETFPPVLVFFDGANHWLADGFHRLHANRKIGAVTVSAEVRNGTLQDAKLYAYGANKSHGLRRSNDDKRKAVLGMLADFSDWSDSKIAKHVGVDHKTVAAQRQPILGNSQDASAVRTVERAGKAYQQDISKIGKSPRDKSGYATGPAYEQPVQRGADHVEPTPYSDEGAPSIEELMASQEVEDKELEAMRRIFEADDKLGEALSIIKQRDALIEQLQWRINGMVNENAELISSVKSWRRKAEKAA